METAQYFCEQYQQYNEQRLCQYNITTQMKDASSFNKSLTLAKEIRQRTRTSCVDLENYMLYQQTVLQTRSAALFGCSICAKPKADTKKQFRRAFKTLTKDEQAQFFLMNAKNIQKFLNTRMKKPGDITQSIEHTMSFIESVIKMQMQIQDNNLYKKFSQVNAQIQTKQKVIKITEVKQQLDLHSFLLRKSRGRTKNCIVLQSSQPYTSATTVRLSFSVLDFQDSYNTIYRIWEQAQYENIKKMLLEQNKFPRKIQGRYLSSLKSNMESLQNDGPMSKIQQKGGSSLFKTFQNRQSTAQTNQINNLKSKIQSNFVNTEVIQSLNSATNFNQQSFGILYQKKGNKVRRLFTLNSKDTTLQQVCLGIDDLKHIRLRKPNITDMKHVNSIPSERTNIYREVDLIQHKQYQFIYFRHYFTQNNATYYFQKSVQLQQFQEPYKRIESITRAKINYVIWRIKDMGNTIEILAQADIQCKGAKDQRKISVAYIGQFAQYIKNPLNKTALKVSSRADEPNNDEVASIKTQQFQNQYLSQISGMQQDQFYTITGSANSEHVVHDQQQQQRYQHNQWQQQQQQPVNMNKKPAIQFKPVQNMKKSNSNQYIQFVTQKQKTKQQGTSRQTDQPAQPTDYYLKCKHIQVPKFKGNPIYLKQPKGHLLFGQEWVISETGELVNINKQKIKMQSSVLKLVLQRMGKNFLSGRGIMNMSLPIQIFGTDSNIERIARGYIYAPIFLQKAAKLKDPVQRMKNVFCFALGFSTSYIKMQKPFNPLLGQTYQGLIDGCPVYAQQISHHPPISSLLMIGRGYRVHGNFEAKIQMGLNSASGLNDGFNNIEFTSDGSTVRFNTPPGEMHGIIIGDRKLTLTKKSYFMDKKNLIFCQMHWGKNKKSERPDSKLNDFFLGKIVKLKSSTNLDDYKKIKPKDIQQQYGELHGRFDGRVYFEDTLLLDLNDQLFAPLMIYDYSPCLLSDSRFRKDIIQRRKNNLSSAQDAKQQIEQLQRKQRKMRHKQH